MKVSQAHLSMPEFLKDYGAEGQREQVLNSYNKISGGKYGFSYNRNSASTLVIIEPSKQNRNRLTPK